MNIRILVAEDNEILREDLCQQLNNQPDFSVTGEAPSGARAVELALAEDFDVILLDIEMESIQAGIDAAARIHPQRPQARIIYLTAHDNDDMILTAMATGAVDYFVKGSDNELLFRHIRMAYAGTPIMSAHTQEVMLREYSRLRRNETSLLYFVNTLASLTPTERELIRYLLQGLNARQISEIRSSAWIPSRGRFTASGKNSAAPVPRRSWPISGTWGWNICSGNGVLQFLHLWFHLSIETS